MSDITTEQGERMPTGKRWKKKTEGKLQDKEYTRVSSAEHT
jgi:hypothetical protein